MINSIEYMHLPVHFVFGLILGSALLITNKDPRKEFVLGFPGVVCHELAHFIVAFILMSDPMPISLIPHREGDRWVLGSVSFTAHWWSAGPAALAPLYLLPGLIYVLFVHAGQWPPGWQIVSGYFCATLAWGLMPSPADWQIAFFSPVGTLFWLFTTLLTFMTAFNGKV
jgi:hypothetical protein